MNNTYILSIPVMITPNRFGYPGWYISITQNGYPIAGIHASKKENVIRKAQELIKNWKSLDKNLIKGDEEHNMKEVLKLF